MRAAGIGVILGNLPQPGTARKPRILLKILLRTTFRSGGGMDRADAILDAVQRTYDAAVLRDLFGPTAAEAEVAVEVGRGQGLQSVVDRLSIAGTTVRSHLARIFDKTGTSRQAELVRLLMGASSRPWPTSEPVAGAGTCPDRLSG